MKFVEITPEDAAVATMIGGDVHLLTPREASMMVEFPLTCFTQNIGHLSLRGYFEGVVRGGRYKLYVMQEDE